MAGLADEGVCRECDAAVLVKDRPSIPLLALPSGKHLGRGYRHRCLPPAWVTGSRASVAGGCLPAAVVASGWPGERCLLRDLLLIRKASALAGGGGLLA